MENITPEMLQIVAQAGEGYVRYLYFKLIFEGVSVFALFGAIYYFVCRMLETTEDS